jgi:hypothetical protein
MVQRPGHKAVTADRTPPEYSAIFNALQVPWMAQTKHPFFYRYLQVQLVQNGDVGLEGLLSNN